MPAGSPRFDFEKPHLFSAPGVKPGRAVLPAHPHPEALRPLVTEKFRVCGGIYLTKKQGPAAPHGEGRALLCPFTLQTGRMNGHTRRVTRESPAAGRPGP